MIYAQAYSELEHRKADDLWKLADQIALIANFNVYDEIVIAK